MFRFWIFLGLALVLGGALAGGAAMGELPWGLFWAFVVLVLALLVLAVIRPDGQFFFPTIIRLKTPDSRPWLALSFDDGPQEETEKVLDVLKEKGVKAVFFLIGEKAARRPDLVRRIHDEGHLIGNHSYHHGFFFDLLGPGSMAREIQKTNAVIEEILGLQPRWFRPPYGVTNPSLAKALRRTKMKSVGWSLRSLDTVSRDPSALLRRILHRLHPGAILLLHDTQPLCHQILPELIDRSREKGFTFVRLDQSSVPPAYD